MPLGHGHQGRGVLLPRRPGTDPDSLLYRRELEQAGEVRARIGPSHPAAGGTSGIVCRNPHPRHEPELLERNSRKVLCAGARGQLRRCALPAAAVVALVFALAPPQIGPGPVRDRLGYGALIEGEWWMARHEFRMLASEFLGRRLGVVGLP